LVAPSGPIDSTTPTYSWNALEGATRYEFCLDRWGYGYVTLTPEQAGCDDGVCSTTPATELVSGPATWWLRAYNGAGWRPWVSLSFQVP
jgi:hypothetical protein